MDVNQTLISAGISIATYILYKIAHRYYIRSGCHDKTISITIVDKEDVTNPNPVNAQEPSSLEMSSLEVTPSR
jgi:hypothetical protein